MEKIIVHTDGGSRGNPGPAAVGVVIERGKEVLAEFGKVIGIATNNEAEYSAVIIALQKAKMLIGKKKAKETEVEILMDSELVVRQLNGVYKLEHEKLFSSFIKVWNLKTEFKKVEFRHMRREENKRADRMVNKALDEEGVAPPNLFGH